MTWLCLGSKWFRSICESASLRLLYQIWFYFIDPLLAPVAHWWGHCASCSCSRLVLSQTAVWQRIIFALNRKITWCNSVFNLDSQRSHENVDISTCDVLIYSFIVQCHNKLSTLNITAGTTLSVKTYFSPLVVYIKECIFSITLAAHIICCHQLLVVIFSIRTNETTNNEKPGKVCN